MCGNPNTRLLVRLIIDFLLLLGLYAATLLLLPQLLGTFERGFHCSDVSLHYPYRQAWLTKVHLTIVVVAFPAALMLVVEMLRAAFVPRGAELKQRFVFVGARIPSFISECYKIIGIYVFGLGLALFLIKSSKLLTGRLRPYFQDVCQPSWSDDADADAEQSCATQPAAHASDYIEQYNCTEFAASLELLTIVHHSFPSGFAASTSYAMCFVICYAQVRLFAPWLRLLRTLLQCGCAALALLVALERVATNQNHLSDVLAGVALGVGLAAFVCSCVANLFGRLRVKRRQWPRQDQIYGYAGYYNRSTYGH